MKVRRGGFVARVTRVEVAQPTLTISDAIADERFVLPTGGDVKFDGATLERVDFSGQTFSHLMAEGTTFVDCDFSRTRFTYVASMSIWKPTLFRSCKFEKADLRNFGFAPGATRFEQCTFRACKIKGWDSYCAEFVECTFASKIETVIFYGTPQEPCTVDRPTNEFRGNDFSEAELIDTSFRRGIDLALQRWPEKSGYRIYDRWPLRHARVRYLIESWPMSDRRIKALRLLDASAPDPQWPSQEKFLDPKSMTQFGVDLRDEIVDLLDSV